MSTVDDWWKALDGWLGKPRVKDRTVFWPRSSVKVEKYRTKSSDPLTCHTQTRDFAGHVVSDLTTSSHASLKHEYLSGYNHPGWRLHRSVQGHDIGGNLDKLDIEFLRRGLTIAIHTTRNDWSGTVMACNDSYNALQRDMSQYPVDQNLLWLGQQSIPNARSISSLNALGATAVARCEPTNPIEDLSTALAELLHDGLPSLPGKAEGNIGEEYLNYQFGWSPTISDGRGFIQAVRTMDSVLQQLHRDSGRMVRRRYTFPQVESTSTTSVSNKLPAPVGQAISGTLLRSGTLKTTTKTIENTWFSGAFTYYLPANALLRSVYDLDKTYGLLPGVDTLWQLTPWSWLVDWFSNTGDVLHNLNAFTLGGLVMPWGYLMNTQEVIAEYQLDFQYLQGSTWIPATVVDIVRYRRLQRVQANPFGFGISWNGLNPFQISILAALAITLAL
jgi:hypothetical protein